MHAAAAAGLPDRVLRRRRRSYLGPGELRRVLQPAPSLDPVDPRQLARAARRLASGGPRQRRRVESVRRLPGGPLRVGATRPRHHLPHDGRRTAGEAVGWSLQGGWADCR